VDNPSEQNGKDELLKLTLRYEPKENIQKTVYEFGTSFGLTCIRQKEMIQFRRRFYYFLPEHICNLASSLIILTQMFNSDTI